MTPIAKALSLSSDGIANVAAYYASQNSPFLPLRPPDPALVRRGEQLARIGSAKQPTLRSRELSSALPSRNPIRR